MVGPAERYLAFLQAIERSPNTVRAYSHSLALWWEFLDLRDRAWDAAGVEDVAEFARWLRAPADNVMLKTRVAHGYCSRHHAAEACPYANICEQCDNFVTTPEFLPALRDQAAGVQALRDDATARGWTSETARHDRTLAAIYNHIRRHDLLA